MVDLGLWFREAYTINRELTPEEAGEMGTGDGESAGGSKCD